jgi:hypothetical protein
MKSRICILLVLLMVIPLFALGEAHGTEDECCDDSDCSNCVCCPCGFQPLGIQVEFGSQSIPALTTEQIDSEVGINLFQEFSLSIERPPRFSLC